MHWTTAKLIALDRAEGFLEHGWVLPAQAAFAEQAKALRHEIPPHLVAAYDRLKADHLDPVVGVFQGKCDGCHSGLSPARLAQLRAENEASHCEQCGRFLYLAGGHDLTAHGNPHRSRTGVPL